MAIKSKKFSRRPRTVNFSKVLKYKEKLIFYKSLLKIKVKPYSVSQYYDFYDYSKINSIR